MQMYYHGWRDSTQISLQQLPRGLFKVFPAANKWLSGGDSARFTVASVQETLARRMWIETLAAHVNTDVNFFIKMQLR